MPLIIMEGNQTMKMIYTDNTYVADETQSKTSTRKPYLCLFKYSIQYVVHVVHILEQTLLLLTVLVYLILVLEDVKSQCSILHLRLMVNNQH